MEHGIVTTLWQHRITRLSQHCHKIVQVAAHGCHTFPQWPSALGFQSRNTAWWKKSDRFWENVPLTTSSQHRHNIITTLSQHRHNIITTSSKFLRLWGSNLLTCLVENPTRPIEDFRHVDVTAAHRQVQRGIEGIVAAVHGRLLSLFGVESYWSPSHTTSGRGQST